MSYFVRLLAVLFVLVGFFEGVASADEINTRRWLRDYQQLKTALAEDYANFQWAIEEHGVDPIALDVETRAGLEAAKTRQEARSVLVAFLAAFQDAGLVLQDKQPQSVPTLGRKDKIAASSPAPLACTQMGFADTAGQNNAAGRFHPALPNDYRFNVWISQRNAFDAAILDLDRGGERIGYIRVPSFNALDYPSACQRVWRARANETAEPCDEDCRKDLMERRVPNLLLDDFARRLEGLEDRRISKAIIDVSGSTGEGEWATAMAQMVAGDNLPCPGLAVPRNRDWERYFSDKRKSVARAFKGDRTPEADAVMEAALSGLEALSAQTKDRCKPADGVWKTPEAASCARVTSAPFSTCGVFAAPPEIDPGASGVGFVLYRPNTYEKKPVPPLSAVHLLIDGKMAAGGEIFASMLQGVGQVSLIGTPMSGAGCYVDEVTDQPLRLKHSQLEVHIPNCQRIGRGGHNLAGGLAVDVSLPEGPSDLQVAQETLIAVLER